MASQPAAWQPPPVRTRSRARDVATIVLLTGSVVLLVLPLGLLWATAAWATGAALLWTSSSWTTGDKALGTLVWPGGLIVPFLLSTAATQVCVQVAEGTGIGGEVVGEPVCTGVALEPWLGIPLALVLLGAPLVVAARLLGRR